MPETGSTGRSPLARVQGPDGVFIDVLSVEKRACGEVEVNCIVGRPDKPRLILRLKQALNAMAGRVYSTWRNSDVELVFVVQNPDKEHPLTAATAFIEQWMATTADALQPPTSTFDDSAIEILPAERPARGHNHDTAKVVQKPKFRKQRHRRPTNTHH